MGKGEFGGIPKRAAAVDLRKLRRILLGRPIRRVRIGLAPLVQVGNRRIGMRVVIHPVGFRCDCPLLLQPAHNPALCAFHQNAIRHSGVEAALNRFGQIPQPRVFHPHHAAVAIGIFFQLNQVIDIILCYPKPCRVG